MTIDECIVAAIIWLFIFTLINAFQNDHEHQKIIDAIAELKDKRE